MVAFEAEEKTESKSAEGSTTADSLPEVIIYVLEAKSMPFSFMMSKYTHLEIHRYNIISHFSDFVYRNK